MSRSVYGQNLQLASLLLVAPVRSDLKLSLNRQDKKRQSSCWALVCVLVGWIFQIKIKLKKLFTIIFQIENIWLWWRCCFSLLRVWATRSKKEIWNTCDLSLASLWFVVFVRKEKGWEKYCQDDKTIRREDTEVNTLFNRLSWDNKQ